MGKENSEEDDSGLGKQNINRLEVSEIMMYPRH